jgi:hypothetical protein
MIRKSMPSGHDPMGGHRFFEKHALGLDPGDHAQTKGLGAALLAITSELLRSCLVSAKP